MLYEVSPSAGYMPTVLTMVNRAKLTAPKLVAGTGQLYGDYGWAPLRNGANDEIESLSEEIPIDGLRHAYRYRLRVLMSALVMT